MIFSTTPACTSRHTTLKTVKMVRVASALALLSVANSDARMISKAASLNLGISRPFDCCKSLKGKNQRHSLADSDGNNLNLDLISGEISKKFSEVKKKLSECDCRLLKGKRSSDEEEDQEESPDNHTSNHDRTPNPTHPTHDPQRKAALSQAGPVDHVGFVSLAANPNFDLKKTIFGNLPGFVGPAFMKTKIGNIQYWQEKRLKAIEEAYERNVEKQEIQDEKNQQIKDDHIDDNDPNAYNYLVSPSNSNVQKTLSEYSPLLDFMNNQCDFKMEHADGSFMDHLYFCRDFSGLHYSKVSPKILFMHSILGVGTNFFPMEIEKLPVLQNLLTPHEWVHVQAFPSILRLLLKDDGMLAELDSKIAKLPENVVKKLTFHRVIDNQKLEMTGKDLWEHLNIQLIHLLDFLPVCHYEQLYDDPLFSKFVRLYLFLQKHQKLEANITFDVGNTILQGLGLGDYVGEDQWKGISDQTISDPKVISDTSMSAKSSSNLLKSKVQLPTARSVSHKPDSSRGTVSISDEARQLPGLPNTWMSCIVRNIPSAIKKNLGGKAIVRYSSEIGHSLDWELEFSQTGFDGDDLKDVDHVTVEDYIKGEKFSSNDNDEDSSENQLEKGDYGATLEGKPGKVTKVEVDGHSEGAEVSHDGADSHDTVSVDQLEMRQGDGLNRLHLEEMLSKMHLTPEEEKEEVEKEGDKEGDKEKKD